jgi:hypothetical protein
MKQDDYIAIIDGTGAWDNGDYAVDMAGSFCAQLALKFGANAHYERGPSAEGYRIKERSERAVSFLTTRPCSADTRYFLAGYSRGGSAALIAADIMRSRNIPVSGLILFDPVNMHLSGSTQGIPANVEASVTFVRRLLPALVKKYAGVFSDPLPRMVGDWVDNPMRPGWTENVALHATAERHKHHLHPIVGSHGALGGVGSKLVDEDPGAQAKVARLANDALASWGLRLSLHAGIVT